MLLVGFFTLAAAGEMAARFVLGLGTPPLSIAHPTIEYMFAPNQDVWRFGNHFLTNEYGMRSPPLIGDTRRRVLVLGDSVPNGGNLTDQRALATSLLSDDATVYMNASAGSWGPPNMLAYVQAFGFFGADRTVIILSSHDAGDVPTFGPLDPNTHPTTRPFSALYEAATRYLPRFLPGQAVAEAAAVPSPAGGAAIPALRQLLISAADHGPVCLVLHSTRLEGDTEEPFAELLRTGQETGATIVRDAAFLDPATSYRDLIHPNDQGQRDLARAIASCVE